MNINKMTFVTNMLKLYLVTDRRYHPEMPLDQQVRTAIEGGVTSVQLREKDLSEADYIEIGKSVHAVTHSLGIPLIINDHPTVAKAIGAEGVHLGQDDGDVDAARKLLGANAIIGVTAKSVEQAITAERCGADYLGVGALFSSKSKTSAKRISFELFDSIAQSVKIPIVGIGGINIDNLHYLAGHSMAGVAVVSALLDQPDILGGTRRFYQQLSEVLK
ncbi:thiamine phosphate synthase [Fusibacter paucivorans]|uniref:Thiamine-phosphate synthase n=1 Tax=Fusibacter paucivorans TaxID=76009 RepID=A0ABS5PU71_9FIRM|nr:thiamine phosphate synthase [Fusibacter paucivorans]MBS7528641.1 thiamine phosphate synthase [Fusibacter paucivorans]